MAIERVGPKQPGFRDVARLRGVDALQPGLILTPPDISADGHIDASVVEHRHALDVTGTFPPIAMVAVDILFGGCRIAVEPPNAFQNAKAPCPAVIHHRGKRVHDAVAAGEEQEVTALHGSQSAGDDHVL